MNNVEALRQLAKLLHGFADDILESIGAESAEAATQQPTEAEQPTEVSETAAAEPEPEPLTMEEIRAVLAEKSRAGHTARVRELLKKHGSTKLSGIDPSEYPALLAEVEVL